VLIPVTFISRDELRPEAPEVTLYNIAEGAAADRRISKQLQEAVDKPGYNRVRTEIKTDLEVFETRKKNLSDILTSLGPLPTGVATLVKVFGNPSKYISPMIIAIIFV